MNLLTAKIILIAHNSFEIFKMVTNQPEISRLEIRSFIKVLKVVKSQPNGIYRKISDVYRE